jgi:hypothetical protein
VLVKSLTAAVATIVFLGSIPAWAQDLGTDRYFRVEHQLERVKGRSRITGYVYNDYLLTAINIRLLVEELDSSGRVVSTAVGYVDEELPPRGQAYFQTPVPKEGATYRVRVQSFTWHRTGY